MYYYLAIIGFLITITAQIFVKFNYNKYKVKKISKELTGLEVAQKILRVNALENIYVVETKGVLGDHYDPKNKVIRLSTDVYNGSDISAAAVAAHEVGHAIQDKEGYFLIKLRGYLFPLVNFSSKLGYAIVLIGLILGWLELFYFGIILFMVILIFQLITLPVEFNASKKAKSNLKKLNIVTEEEMNGVNKVLKAAAFTYVASLATTILEILRLLLIANNRD